MKNLAVFAHYDNNNKIEDYVIYYLEGLKKVVEEIIFVSDCNLPQGELDKISPIVSHSIAKKHEEYDFGSYKRGFLYALENGLLEDKEQCIFANDSCFAPLFSFKEMFDEMSSKDVDFWGVTENKKGLEDFNFPHIQSCFIVFKENVFLDDRFVDFIKKITKQPSKDYIIRKYEIGLSQYLTTLGYKYSSYVPSNDEIDNLLIRGWKDILIKHKCPLLKTSLARFENKGINALSLAETIKNITDYPVMLINNQARKISFLKKSLFYFIEKRRAFIRILFAKRQAFLFGKWYKTH